MTVTGPPEPIAPPPNDGGAKRRASMDRSMVRGLAWTGGATVATQALRWSITLYIARILSPADYGLVGMALVYTGLVQLVNDFGLSSAIIQQRDLKADLFSRVAGFGIALGFALFALSAALAVPISYFFGEPAVRNIVIALGAKFILDSLAMPSRAMLARDLRFRALAAIDATDALVAGVTALVAALAGAAYWSLVIGTLAGSLSGVLLALWIRPYRPALPGRLRDIEHSVRLGRDVVVSSVAWYGYSNADFLIVGRLLDKTALGLYTFAWNIASIPVEKVAALVGRVTPGIFSAVQHDTAAMRRYFLSLTEAIAFVTFPMSAGFALVADDLVRGLLGEKWVPAITTLKLLACYAGLRSVSTLPSHVMVMRGRADLARRASLITVMILPLAFLIGTRWGIVGVALGWLFAYPLCVVMCDYRYVSQLLELHPKRLAQAIWPAVAATSIMVLVLLGARMALPDGASHLIRLFVLTILGIAVYAGVALLTQGDRVRAFASVARQSLGRETSA